MRRDPKDADADAYLERESESESRKAKLGLEIAAGPSLGQIDRVR